MTRSASSFAVLMTALLLAGCNALTPAHPIRTATEDSKAGEKALRVGITPNYPPMVYRERGQIMGVEAELAALLADRTERTLVYHELPWESLIPALEKGQIDIVMSGMSITDMRRQRVQFSTPYMRLGQMALIRATDRRKFPDPRLIAVGTTKIGVEKGTTGDLFVMHNCPKSSRKTYRDIDRAVKALLKGDVEVVVHDGPLIWQTAALHENDGLIPLPGYLTKEYAAWAVARGNDELLKQANDALEALAVSGELGKIIRRWVPDVALR